MQPQDVRFTGSDKGQDDKEFDRLLNTLFPPVSAVPSTRLQRLPRELREKLTRYTTACPYSINIQPQEYYTDILIEGKGIKVKIEAYISKVDSSIPGNLQGNLEFADRLFGRRAKIQFIDDIINNRNTFLEIGPKDVLIYRVNKPDEISWGGNEAFTVLDLSFILCPELLMALYDASSFSIDQGSYIPNQPPPAAQ